jgi:DNA polymerase
MTWDERQRAMLAEMGLRVWSPVPLPDAAPEAALAEDDPPKAAAAVAAVQALPAALRAAAPVAAPVEASPPMPATARMAQSPANVPANVPANMPAIASMDWDQLRATAADCRACALCGGRGRSVFGAGSTRAQWLVVGEAPGEREDAQGEPFAGPAAQLLGNMLRAINLSAEAAPEAGLPPERQVYLSSALKCRPPPGSTPGPGELQQCHPYLARQIELLKPRIILAMGRMAVQTLLGSNEPLGRLRGRVHAYQGTPVIVTLAPGYLLRNLGEKARAWEDLCLARATLQGLGPA